MALSLRVTSEEEKLIREYAKFHGLTVSECLKQAIMEKIEDEYDAKIADEAYAEFLKDPVTIPFEEVLKKFNEEI